MHSAAYKNTTEWRALTTDIAKVDDVDVGNSDAYEKLDFNNIWTINETGCYPILKNNSGATRRLNDLQSLDCDVENLKVKGYNYKSIKLTWDDVDDADSYIVIQGEIRKDVVDAYAVYAGSETYTRVYDNEHIAKNLKQNGEKHYVFQVIPVFVKDGVEYYGYNAGFGSGVPVVTNSESDYDDTTSPIINDVIVLTKETYKPGAIKVRIKASDSGSGITSINIKVINGYLGMEGSEPSLSYTKKISKAKTLDTVITIPVGLRSLEGGELKSNTYAIGNICISDAAGNKSYVNGTMVSGDVVEIKDEFDIEFEGVLSNKNVPNELASMDDGKTVLLKVDTKSNGILKKEVLDAIKGQDKTVVVYVDGAGSRQWVFYSKDITGETKNLDLNVSVTTEAGSGYGCTGSIVRLKYANNGTLP